jgi:hypothetical protein
MTANCQSAATDLRRMIVGYRLSQALHVVAKLGIADLLTKGPRKIEDLAEATDSHPSSLYRVLRLLACEGVFEELDEGRFTLTPLAQPLCSDAPDSLLARAIFDGEAWNWHPWGHLLHSTKTGGAAFDHTYGAAAFDYFKETPEAASSFDSLMAAQTRPWALSVADAYDFSDIATLVDVGGGYGALLAGILAANSHLKGILVDLPHVVTGARPKLEEAGLAGRCETVAGDFFRSVPTGGDAYILKHVLHDWDDERCHSILENCRRAVSDKGRLLVVEILIAPGNEPDYGKYLDLNMLVLTKGRERTEEQYRTLFEAAGFTLSRVVQTGSELSIIEGRPNR